MEREIAKNLASLNEIITELTAVVSDDRQFAEMVRNTLRDHSWALGFEFQGQRAPAEPDDAPLGRRIGKPGDAVRVAKLSRRKWAVWSWDERSRVWMAVAEGSEKDMTAALNRKQSAAARLLPSARFTMTPKNQPPTEAPE